jgi:hypothetical protein
MQRELTANSAVTLRDVGARPGMEVSDGDAGRGQVQAASKVRGRLRGATISSERLPPAGDLLEGFR